ncbi:MAG: YihY/virulence factor BrkB family protein [Sandaracinus sp.]|nr:YihY/virulence factor BrkB family protein [Sandaracinus sp.]MCB9616570.1 YihY/virulence factor BrkB family protein [Sandaracinus sp.]
MTSTERAPERDRTPDALPDPEHGCGRRAWHFVRDVTRRYLDDDVPHLSAAMAFYGVLSVGPILVILLWVLRVFTDDASARSVLLRSMRQRLGTDLASMLSEGIDHARTFDASGVAAVVAFVFFLVAATRLFASLQTALDRIWHREGSHDESLTDLIRGRVLGLVLVALLGTLLVAGVGAKVLAVGAARQLGLEGVPLLWKSIDALVSTAVLTPVVVFAFRRFPRTTVRRRDAWRGAFITSALLVVGSELVSLYVSTSDARETFGAAGALVALLLWIYYAAQVFLVGALVTRRLARDVVEARREDAWTTGTRRVRHWRRERRERRRASREVEAPS